MNHQRVWALTRPVASCWLLLIGSLRAEPVTATQLELKIAQQSYEVYEPVVVHVLVRTISKVHQSAAPETREARGISPIPHRLRAQLRSPRGVVADAMLIGGGFDSSAEKQHDIEGTFIACLGNRHYWLDEVRFSFWGQLGSFQLVVLDPDNGLESNAVPITIVPPDDPVAAELFRCGGIASIALLVGSEHGENAIAEFEELSSRHRYTVYGKYARASLILRRLDQATNSAGKTAVDEQLVRQAEDILQEFSPGHPIRNRAMLGLLKCETFDRGMVSMGEVINRLEVECRDSLSLSRLREERAGR